MIGRQMGSLPAGLLTCTHRIGAFATSFGLPLVVYLGGFLCNDIAGCPVPSVLSPSTLSIDKLKAEVGWPKEGITGLASWRVTRYVLAYYFTSLCLWAFLPAEEVQGSPLRSGGRLKYRFNGTYTIEKVSV